ncbi:hypothetical protein AMK32_08550 [Streptomyces sp. CB01883]|nr:hypothetical protein AMK32_08550 [Streptomyces sp. CB01883]
MQAETASASFPFAASSFGPHTGSSLPGLAEVFVAFGFASFAAWSLVSLPEQPATARHAASSAVAVILVRMGVPLGVLVRGASCIA